MNCHYLSYVTRLDQPNQYPIGQTLLDQISSLNLKSGDILCMTDDTFYGYYSDNRSAFFGSSHKNGGHGQWQFILDSYIKPRIICTSPSKRLEAYSKRTIITPKGQVFKQVLISYFGEPAWVNTPSDSIINIIEDSLLFQCPTNNV